MKITSVDSWLHIVKADPVSLRTLYDVIVGHDYSLEYVEGKYYLKNKDTGEVDSVHTFKQLCEFAYSSISELIDDTEKYLPCISNAKEFRDTKQKLVDYRGTLRHLDNLMEVCI